MSGRKHVGLAEEWTNHTDNEFGQESMLGYVERLARSLKKKVKATISN